jgi:hypothetical protein
VLVVVVRVPAVAAYLQRFAVLVDLLSAPAEGEAFAVAAAVRRQSAVAFLEVAAVQAALIALPAGQAELPVVVQLVVLVPALVLAVVVLVLAVVVLVLAVGLQPAAVDLAVLEVVPAELVDRVVEGAHLDWRQRPASRSSA